MSPPPPNPFRPSPLNPGAGPAAHIEQLLRAGSLEQAAAAALAWAAKAPKDANAMHFASVTQHKVGNDERALHYAQRAAGLEPANPHRHSSLARCLYLNLKSAEALASMERAARLAPKDLDVLTDYALMLSGQQRYLDALRVSDQALAHHPGAGGVLINKVSLLVSVGRSEEGFTLATQIAQALPTDLYSRSLRCLTSNYLLMPPGEVLDVHKDFGTCLSRASLPIIPRAPRGERKKLRIGIISADLRAHSVTFFLEPLLEHIDRSRFEVFVYHINKLEDEVTVRLRRHTDRWWLKNSASAEEIARAVADDACDIMLDLAGHTQPQSMIAAAMRPAPVQVTWLGYPNTTGVRDMGWRLVDSASDPVGTEAQATEKLLRLDPCFLCYRPPDDAPEAPPLPAEDQPVTFVSFNSLQKINPLVAGLWRRVLDRVPGSRLLLKMTNVTEETLQKEVRERLHSWGLPSERTTILLSTRSRADHLRLYGQAHVALDTFPYHGTTTTCEALWMGVPAVTLSGDRHASRVGPSILRALGGDAVEWVARSESEFVDKAAALAMNRTLLTQYRADLRARMAQSALCDGAAFAARFGTAMHTLWRDRFGTSSAENP